MIQSRPASAGFISDSELLRRAFALAEHAHGNQRRATDQTRFIEHVVEVGELLHTAGFDERLVAAGLLHDAVERGQLSEAELRAEMDEDICALVMALTEDATIESFDRRKEALRDQVRRGEPGAMTIFAADKLSDIRGLARGVVRSEGSIEARMGTSVEAMTRHYGDSVRTIEMTDPSCGFIPELRAELDALDLTTASAAPPRPNTRARKRSGWSAVPH